LNEVAPFYHYTFAKLFGVSLNKDQTEALFHLMDADGGTEVWLCVCCVCVGLQTMIRVFTLHPSFYRYCFHPSLCLSFSSWGSPNSSCKLEKGFPNKTRLSVELILYRQSDC